MSEISPKEPQEGERTAPWVALPVQNEPMAFIIEGEKVGPETVIGEGRDLTEREARIVKIWLMETQGPVCACPLKDALLIDADGFPKADVHHFRRRPDGKRLHQMKWMAFADHRHNARLGKPPVVGGSHGGEREEKVGVVSINPPPTSAETAASYRMYPRAVELLFHPQTGRLATLGMTANRDDVANRLPEWVKEGRAPTYGRYLTEFVKQGFLTLTGRGEGAVLTRTGKSGEIVYAMAGLTWPGEKRAADRLEAPKEEARV
jgi:hypothetical protein